VLNLYRISYTVTDDVTVSATGTFADKNVGTGKVVTLSETTGGADVANYTITNQGTTTADITPAALTIGGITAINKTYDGNTAATTDVSRATFAGLVTGDVVTVSATGTFADKNVGDGKAVSLTETNAGADVANYTITNQGTTTANITKKALTIDSALSSASKVYDGTRTAVVSRSDLVGLVDGEDLIASGGGNYDNANVGTGKTITISYTLADGVTGLASNYSISTQTTNNGIITKAPLTVTAIDDAKFVTESDPTFTFVYNGFVNGETAGALVASGQFVTGNVSRSNSATNAAGTYANVLVPGGFSADNYSINAVNGDFTIVPADQLLVKITPVSNVTYANNPVYDNTTGTHHYTAKYLDGGNNQIINLTANVVASNNNITINDGLGTIAVFDISAKDASLSNSNNLVVGGYNLEASNAVITGTNFNSLVVTGSLTVDPVHIDVTNNEHISVSSITKTYDGTATISSVPITFDTSNSIIQTGDLVTISGTGSYIDRHVGAGKTTTIDIALSGNDSGNYALIDSEGNANTRITENVGVITQLPSVVWTGATSAGEWSDAANWDGGAIPDRNNVATAIIPNGYSVIYNSDVVGQISNTAIQNNGVIEFNGSSAFEFDSIVSGIGNLKHSGSGILTISGDNTYSGSLDITNKEVLLTHNNALGTGNSIISNSGSLSIGSGVTLPSLTVTGAITIKTDVTTTGAQIYNNDVTVYSASNSRVVTVANDGFNLNTYTQEIIPAGEENAGNGDISFNPDTDGKDWKIFRTENADITFNSTLKSNGSSLITKHHWL
jgi:autotransporter-associated beta strand protein